MDPDRKSPASGMRDSDQVFKGGSHAAGINFGFPEFPEFSDFSDFGGVFWSGTGLKLLIRVRASFSAIACSIPFVFRKVISDISRPISENTIFADS